MAIVRKFIRLLSYQYYPRSTKNSTYMCLTFRAERVSFCSALRTIFLVIGIILTYDMPIKANCDITIRHKNNPFINYSALAGACK